MEDVQDLALNDFVIQSGVLAMVSAAVAVAEVSAAAAVVAQAVSAAAAVMAQR